MDIPPLARQFITASATHVAVLSAGGIVAYPGVLLQQLQANDTIIKLDLEKTSWIGSLHGIAGFPTVLVPLMMQYKGRKLVFLLSCIFIIIGWTFTYFAQNITILMIGECFHGLGGTSLHAVSFLGVSEMAQPEYRNTLLLIYGTLEVLGISSVGILGRFFHWKTVGLIMGLPAVLALLIGLAWPESPAWLAYKGKFGRCEKVFIKLRGTDEESKKELKAMVDTYKERLRNKHQRSKIKLIFRKIIRRDFYLPALHSFVIINVLYWGGGIPTMIYAVDMIVKCSGRPNKLVKLIMDCTLFIGYNIASVLVRYNSSKKVMLFSMSGAAVFMSSAAIVTYLQTTGQVSNDSELGVYLLLGFVMFMSLGCTSIGFSMASEVMPVKHRGIGGSLFVFYTCAFHSLSMKAYPYLCVYIKICGVFSIYAVYTICSILFIWKFVPNTKNRTLLEIEEFYNVGYFKEDVNNDTGSNPLVGPEILLT